MGDHHYSRFIDPPSNLNPCQSEPADNSLNSTNGCELLRILSIIVLVNNTLIPRAKSLMPENVTLEELIKMSPFL